MKVAVISANLGSYDPPRAWPELQAPAGVEVSVHRFTDENFPPRPLAMTSRLQCGIPKWFGWELVPGHDVYIWVDASCTPTPVLVPWFLEHLGTANLAVFAHPDRATVREEYEFMKARMARPGERYLTSRYRGEWLDEQFAHSEPDAPLIASTAFCYRFGYSARDQFPVHQALSAVWLHKTRYLLHDQLAFSTMVQRYGIRPHWIHESYLRCAALTFTRKAAR